MSGIKMVVDRLLISQKDSSITITHEENEGLKVVEESITTDGEEVTTFIQLDKEEKGALIKYLLENKI